MVTPERGEIGKKVTPHPPADQGRKVNLQMAALTLL